MLFDENVIRFLQSFRSPALDALFLIITTMGTEYIFIGLAAVVYWSYDRRFGIRLAMLMLFSFYANLTIKEIFKMPRPPNSLRIDYPFFPGLYSETYGFPSGHAMNSTVFWFAVARWAKKRFVYFIGGTMIILISFSRLYLGFHFLGDILGGVLFGVILAIAYFYSGNRIAKFYNGLGDRSKLVLFAALGLLFLFPFNIDSVKVSGGFLGFALGYFAACRLEVVHSLDLVARASSRQRKFERSIMGLVMLALGFAPFFAALHFFHPTGATEFMAYFLLYLVTGLLIALAIPKALDKLEK